MMICPYCRNQFRDGTQVCTQCGAPLIPVQQMQQGPQSPFQGRAPFQQQQNPFPQRGPQFIPPNNNIPQKPKKKVGCLGIIGILLLLGLLGSCFGGGSRSNSSSSGTKSATPQTTAAKTTTEKKTETTKAVEQKKIEVEITASGHWVDDGLVFEVATNLPDKAELMLTLSSGDYNTDNAFTAQTKATVENGKAVSEGFKDGGKKISGDFDLSVSMGLPSIQERSVQDVIGKNGENMTGSLVTNSSGGRSNVVKALFKVSAADEIDVSAEEDYSYTVFKTEDTETEKPETTKPEDKASQVTEKSDNNDSLTMGQMNALLSAKLYIKSMGFSRDGLIDQLVFEGYTNDEAVYAVDNCSANWNDEAVQSAKQYVKLQAFSYSGLIEQLEYEQFTSEQARYGADNCGADWNAEAVESAKGYLSWATFSRSELIDQLIYEGSTAEQAEYGAQGAGY